MAEVAPPLSSYAFAMRCPVLTKRMILRLRYAMSGTDQAYGPSLRLCGVRPYATAHVRVQLASQVKSHRQIKAINPRAPYNLYHRSG
eukprot:111549-Rhodomonas_salina.2